MPDLNVLVVDDEPAVRQVLAAAVAKAGYAVESVSSATEALERLSRGNFDVVLSDVQMPDCDGIELLRQARGRGVGATFIMVTAFASVDSAIDAIKAGASDYITKPVRHEEIVHRLEQIEAMRGLRDDNRALRSLVLGGGERVSYQFSSPAMLATERLISRVAPTDSTVLLSGESGTGKGVAARRVHELSTRRDGPFVAVNCGAIPDTLIESELFGHTKGAFTGADRPRKGLFAQADHGSIFLDEIGELPLALQTKLLHVLEGKEVRALGSEQARRIDVRILAATNRDLPAMVAQGRFREDLFFRLSVFQITMPALRERRADIPGLLRHLMAQRAAAGGVGAQPGGTPLGIDPEAEEMLVSYPWPGNVRQLENVLHRATILADGGCIRAADLPPEVTRTSLPANSASIGGGNGAPGSTGTDAQPEGGGLRERVRRFEVNLILRAIEDAGGDRRLAAQRLGIGLSSLYRKLEEFNGDAAAA
jgi:two-component system response regulator AtoC